MILETDAQTQTNECRRCGTCCRKGGPGLHKEDRDLIEKGKIPLKHLYTIRKGEIAFDNIRNTRIPISSDIIKIKSAYPSRGCVYFIEESNLCSIHENRPLECRALNCRDTREIEYVYERDRITRHDLVNTDGLNQVINEHDRQCNPGDITDIVSRLEGSESSFVLNRLCEMLHYDEVIRELTIQKTRIKEDVLDFLFGRPLIRILPAYGLKVRKEQKSYKVTPVFSISKETS